MNKKNELKKKRKSVKGVLPWIIGIILYVAVMTFVFGDFQQEKSDVGFEASPTITETVQITEPAVPDKEIAPTVVVVAEVTAAPTIVLARNDEADATETPEPTGEMIPPASIEVTEEPEPTSVLEVTEEPEPTSASDIAKEPTPTKPISVTEKPAPTAIPAAIPTATPVPKKTASPTLLPTATPEPSPVIQYPIKYIAYNYTAYFYERYTAERIKVDLEQGMRVQVIGKIDDKCQVIAPDVHTLVDLTMYVDEAALVDTDPGPAPTPTPTPIPSPEPSPVPTMTPRPTDMPTPSPIPAVSWKPTEIPTPSPTLIPINTPIPTCTLTPTAIPTPTCSPIPTPTPPTETMKKYVLGEIGVSGIYGSQSGEDIIHWFSKGDLVTVGVEKVGDYYLVQVPDGRWGYIYYSGIGDKNPTIRYSYDIRVVGSYKIYDGEDFFIYVKTDDPDMKQENFQLSKGDLWFSVSFATIWDVYPHDAEYYYSITKTKDGYIVMLQAQKNAVGENAINIIRDGEVQKSFGITIHDYDAAEKAWLQNMIASVTTADMTGKEKMTAICSYVKNTFSYYGGEGNYMADTTRDFGAFFESMRIDCLGATYIMIECAKLLGYEAEATYAGYLNHHYATVYIDGTAYKYDANPIYYPQVDRYNTKQLTWDTCQWK